MGIPHPASDTPADGHRDLPMGGHGILTPTGRDRPIHPPGPVIEASRRAGESDATRRGTATARSVRDCSPQGNAGVRDELAVLSADYRIAKQAGAPFVAIESVETMLGVRLC